MKKTLPVKPLSINKCWKGRRFKTNDYKDYEQELLYLLKNSEKVSGFVNVNYKIYLINFLKSDVGNIEKPLTDIIVKSGIIDDDRFILKLTLEKFKSETDKIEIEIMPVEN